MPNSSRRKKKFLFKTYLNLGYAETLQFVAVDLVAERCAARSLSQSLIVINDNSDDIHIKQQDLLSVYIQTFTHTYPFDHLINHESTTKHP